MASAYFKGKTVNRKDVKLTESEIRKLRKENVTLDEVTRQKGEQSDSENNSLLLQRILALETLREKNSQQILSRDEEIASLRQQLRPGGAKVERQRLDAEMREKLFQSLKQETDELKNKYSALSVKYQELENRHIQLESGTADGQTTSRDATGIQEHLKDALEKNQQWLTYDQQREDYVKKVLAGNVYLEQQLNQANNALQEKDKEARSKEKQAVKMQQHYEELLRAARMELKVEKERVAEGRSQLSQLQELCEDKEQEVVEMRQQKEKKLQEERRNSVLSARLEEERSAELLQQVSLLQKSLLSQHEEKNRMLLLEQQIQLSAKSLEDATHDNLRLQQQLRRLLKELQKAEDQVARLKSEKMQRGPPSTELSAPTKLVKASMESQHDSPTRACLLNESFLECPNCRAQYPTSRHRDLLVHIEQCFD